MAEKSRALSAHFASADIPVLFVKGLTLGKLAYGDIATKAAVDIDLLIEPRRLAEAAALLDANGYQRVQPSRAMTMTQLAAWHALRKESTWRKRDSRLQVDLHTRLADNDRLIPAIGIGSPRQTVELLPAIALPTLRRDELFAYLCVHGASSAWFRLKWICDLAALIEQGANPWVRFTAARNGSARAGPRRRRCCSPIGCSERSMVRPACERS